MGRCARFKFSIDFSSFIPQEVIKKRMTIGVSNNVKKSSYISGGYFFILIGRIGGSISAGKSIDHAKFHFPLPSLSNERSPGRPIKSPFTDS